jgi:adenylate cyclase
MPMNDTRAQRRLAAILAADVAGFSRMMGVDEAGTLATLRTVWETKFNPSVARHRGRVVKMMGDGALVEFASAIDAVECALAIQGEMASFNQSRQGVDPVELRMGINLGDIVIDGDDIFGDGVNVAARLESHAPKSGILIADNVHALVKDKIKAEFNAAGDLSLKNIAAPVRAWRWGSGETPVPAAGTVLSARETVPSIAVLPFNNMSGDPEQEYFSDGITEDIITDLSKISGLLVIARNSSFAYKGKAPDIRVVGRELGVTKVLEGSIRRAGNRVRITAQLIDAATGGHLWAERYDRNLTDIFDVQDEVTLQIVDALKVTLKPVDKALLAAGRTRSLEAHDLVLRGRELLFGAVRNRETNERAIAAFQRAIELDPDYAEPYAGIAIACHFSMQNHWSEKPDLLEEGKRYADKAVEKGPNEPFCHYAFGRIAYARHDVAAMALSADRALALNANYAPSLSSKGLFQTIVGTPLAGIPYLERAMRLDPLFAHQAIHFLGLAYLVAGQDAIAVEKFRERIRLVPKTDLSRGLLASALGHLGEVEEARQVWGELMEINPRYTITEHVENLGLQQERDRNRIFEGLAKAGLPTS